MSVATFVVEETSSASKQHTIQTTNTEAPTIYEILHEDGALRFRLKNQSLVDPNSLALLYLAPTNIIKLEALADNISVHPGHLDDIPLTLAARRIFQLNLHASIFLRSDDTVKFHFPTQSPSRLQFKVGLQMTTDPAVQVHSSIPIPMADQVDETWSAGTQSSHADDFVDPPVQISRTLPEQKQEGLRTPIAKRHNNFVQETPATSDRLYDALLQGNRQSSPLLQNHDSLVQTSQNETQIKAEEESQLKDSADPSADASSPLRQDPSLRETVMDSFEQPPDSNEPLNATAASSVLVLEQQLSVPFTESKPTKTPTPPAPQPRSSDETEDEEDNSNRKNRDGTTDCLDTEVAFSTGTVMTKSTPTKSRECSVPPSRNQDKPLVQNENLGSQTEGLEERAHEKKVSTTTIRPIKSRLSKRKSGDGEDIKDAKLQPASKKSRPDVEKMEDEHGQSSDEEKVIRPRMKVTVMIPPSKRSSTTPVRSTRGSANPPSSIGSTQSTTRASTASGSGTAIFASPKTVSGSGKGPRVVFSNSTINEKPSVMKFFRGQGGLSIDHTTAPYDVLVVGNGEIKKTLKFLMTIALGKPIATDDWIIQSNKTGKLLDVSAFIPSDPIREAAWGINLEEIMGKDRYHLFNGKTILITRALKKEYGGGYAEVENLAQAAGVETILNYTRDVKVEESTIALAKEKDDLDAVALTNEGVVCYSRDFLSISILRGFVDLESDEFKIVPSSTAEARKKARGGKARK